MRNGRGSLRTRYGPTIRTAETGGLRPMCRRDVRHPGTAEVALRGDDATFDFYAARRIIALVATPEAPVTKTALQLGTWFQDVPRICRTPSRMRLNPWT